jgi:ribosomal protein S18 acetylase RimI-like enzyme
VLGGIRLRDPARIGILSEVVTVREATAEDVEGCVAVLAGLPGYFTVDTHDDLRTSFPHGRGWVATAGTDVIGFVLVVRRYPRSAEITYAAVRSDQWDNGVGTALVDASLDGLAKDGVVIVEVKTLDASAGYEPYVATRAFWELRGFVQLDCIDPLPGWQPGNPSAIYVASLNATR